MAELVDEELVDEKPAGEELAELAELVDEEAVNVELVDEELAELAELGDEEGGADEGLDALEVVGWAGVDDGVGVDDVLGAAEVVVGIAGGVLDDGSEGIEDVEGMDEDDDDVEDTTGGGRTKGPQGSVDIKSLATYRFRCAGPPQISDESPLHGMLHALLGAAAVPLPRTTPQ